MDKVTEVKTVKEYVEDVLKNDLRARSDDKWLIIRVLQVMGFKVYIDYKQLKNIPAFETITRCRRKFQEEGHYESSEQAKIARKIHKEQMNEINDWWGAEF